MVPKFLKGIHWPIFLLAVILTGIGIVSIYSASFRTGGDYAFRQLLWMAAAVSVFFLTILIGYRAFLNAGYLFYAASVLLLIMVFAVGIARSGAHRWIGIGPVILQPAELAKIATLMVLAHFLTDQSSFSRQKRTIFAGGLLALIPFLLILKQPDLGSALVFLPALFLMLFFWGIRLKYVLILLISITAAIPFAWHFLKPYQQKRILVFLNPAIDPIGASYTAIQSKIAVGSGGLFGKGWLRGTQTQLDFVPEHHTDFIFCVIGEEFGFLGSILVILLFAFLIRYAFQIIQHTTDLRARLLALGITTLIFFQAFVNIGMTVGLAPITGITLPFISYGGSSLIATFFGLGLLASIHKERSIF